ncbi:MAG: hypothetical protein F6K26_31610 [Moorea sp. SIO2I5]|nr:hypothetical protein [Moorena sp. SIO2I5]
MGNIRCSYLDEKFSNLVKLLRYRAITQPAKIAYTFQEKREGETAHITYEILDQPSRAIGS